MKLDNYDRTLLAALQGDGRVPQSELGQRAHLSTGRSTADSSCSKARG